jgi:hypothetical protein
MKKCILSFAIFFISHTISAQKITESQIAGNWKVVTVMSQSADPKFKEILKGFGTAKFVFGGGHIFKLENDSNSAIFRKIIQMTNAKQWKFSADQQAVKIGDSADGFSVMEIKVIHRNGKLFFTCRKLISILKSKKYNLFSADL